MVAIEFVVYEVKLKNSVETDISLQSLDNPHSHFEVSSGLLIDCERSSHLGTTRDKVIVNM